MFENLSERLERSLKILKGEGRITEVNVAETFNNLLDITGVILTMLDGDTRGGATAGAPVGLPRP